MAVSQFTELMPNEVITRLERMRFNPLQRLTSRHRGEHLRGKGGRSTEFADYRDYSPGDDTRFIDWNIYSRLHRPYLKLFQLEEEMNILIIIDATESMAFDGKLEMAKKIAASFAVIALYGAERVSMYVLNDQGKHLKCLPPTQGRFNMKKMFDFVEGIECHGVCPLELGVDQVMKYHHGQGIAVVLSDFMTFGDVKRACNVLFSAGLEMYAIQILSPIELEPDLTQDLRLVDAETEDTLDITAMGALLDIYHEHRLAFEEELTQICRQRFGRFMTINSEDFIGDVMFNNLLRKGWIK